MTTIKLKNGRTIEFPSFAERDRLPLASQEYIWDYGARQSINDSTAPCVRKSFDPDEWDGMTFDEAVDMAAAARVESIMAGTVGSRQPTESKKAAVRALAKQLDALSEDEFAALLERLGPIVPTAKVA